MVPGRKFSISTSEPSARRRNSSRPSDVRMSRATLRLFLFMARNCGASPPYPSKVLARRSSPPSGRSTLITSAPMSPRSREHIGPARICEQSRTRIPFSGRVPDRDSAAIGPSLVASGPAPDEGVDALPPVVGLECLEHHLELEGARLAEPGQLQGKG